MELTWGRDAIGLELTLMWIGNLDAGLLALSWLADGGHEEDLLLLVEDVGSEEEGEEEEEANAALSHLLMDIQTI